MPHDDRSPNTVSPISVGLGLAGPAVEAVGAQMTILSTGSLVFVISVIFTTQPIVQAGSSTNSINHEKNQ